jgi:hypothetical protein
MLQAGRSPVWILDEVDFFSLPYPSNRTMALGSTKPQTKMSTRNLPEVKSGRRVGLTTLPPCMNRMSENVGASTSRNPEVLHGLYRDNFTFFTLLLLLLCFNLSPCYRACWCRGNSYSGLLATPIKEITISLHSFQASTLMDPWNRPPLSVSGHLYVDVQHAGSSSCDSI